MRRASRCIRWAAQAVIVLAPCLLAQTARADVDSSPAPSGRPTRGWQLGARAGYAFPVGSAFAPSPLLMDFFQGAVPIGLEGGYRIDRLFYIGATFTGAPGLLPHADSTCWYGTAPPSCSRQDFQLAASARLYVADRRRVGVWVGGGFGWELMATQISQGASSASETFTGPLLLNLELGVDLHFGAFTVGPFASLSFGEYLFRSQDPTPSGFSSSVPTALYEWTTLGLRGTYGPW